MENTVKGQLALLLKAWVMNAAGFPCSLWNGLPQVTQLIATARRWHCLRSLDPSVYQHTIIMKPQRGIDNALVLLSAHIDNNT